MHTKDEVLENFKIYKPKVENLCTTKVNDVEVIEELGRTFLNFAKK